MAFYSFLPAAKDLMCATRTPLLQGEVFVFRTLLEDGSDSGDVLSMVLQANALVPMAYDIKVLVFSSGYYRWHFIERTNAPSVHVLRLPRSEVDAMTYQKWAVILENATRWRSFGRGEPICWDLIPWIDEVSHRSTDQTVDLLRKWLAEGNPKAKVRAP